MSTSLTTTVYVSFGVLAVGFGRRHWRFADHATLSTLLANMALGQGPWTLYQAIGWSGVALLGRLLRTWLATNHPDGPQCT